MGASAIRKVVVWLLVLFMLFGGTSPALAVNRNIGLDVIGYDSDVQVVAPYASIAFDFPIPRLAKLTSASATLSLTPSAQLNAENIFFFYFNDKLVETRTVRQLRQQNTFTLNLPLDGVFRDSARLVIKSNMFITDDLCRDYYSGGLFFTVHKNTVLNLSYDMQPIRTVSDFFGSFQQAVLVVVPDGADLAELSPGAWTYGFLRKAFPHLDVQLIRSSEVSKYPPVPRIWIGTTAKLPAYFKNTAPGIAIVDLNTLLISAPDAGGLKGYVQQLADLPVFPLNPTAAKRIEIKPLETPSGKATEAIAFGNNGVQEGILLVPADFQLHPALLEKPPERLGIHLEGSHTVTFETVRPVRMDVFLNNNLVYSSVLDQTGQFKRDIVLPEPVELRSRNSLNIQFNYPEEPGQCRVRGKIQSAQIFPTSYMWGAGHYRFDRFAWSNVGLFFGRQGTVLVDEALGKNILKTAGELAYFLNRQLPPNVFAFPEFWPLSLQADVPAGNYVVVAAMTGNVPQAMQDRMPISLGRDFTVYRKTTKATLFEYQASVNSVVGRVGELKGGPLVILSANLDGALLPETLRYLSIPKHYDSMNGNVFVFQQPNRLYSFDVRDKSIKVEHPAATGMAHRLWEQNRMLIVAAMGLLALLIIGVLIARLVFPRKPKNDPPPPAPPGVPGPGSIIR